MTDIVSIIITIFNGEKWIDRCFASIASQDVIEKLRLEVCVFDDASTDKTAEMLEKWVTKLRNYGIDMRILRNGTSQKGVGYGRNKAVQISSGNYLCFQDIDDEMFPQRIMEQYKLAQINKNAIIGSRFIRLPENSTCRYTKWANEITPEKLNTQIYTSNGPTIIMPTWFCYRRIFERVGGFSETGQGTPEDLLYFYKHLEIGGDILRSDKVLLTYRYHPEATTFSISERTIWNIRFERLIQQVLNKEPWSKGFTIWNAGKQGRRFFRDLPIQNKALVKAFCDVDKKKVNKFYNYYDEKQRRVTFSVPIIHFSKASAPIVVCMKLFLTNGCFEENLQSLNLVEGLDYVIFS